MNTRLIQTPNYGHPVNTDTIYGPLSVLIKLWGLTAYSTLNALTSSLSFA